MQQKLAWSWPKELKEGQSVICFDFFEGSIQVKSLVNRTLGEPGLKKIRMHALIFLYSLCWFNEEVF